MISGLVGPKTAFRLLFAIVLFRVLAKRRANLSTIQTSDTLNKRQEKNVSQQCTKMPDTRYYPRDITEATISTTN